MPEDKEPQISLISKPKKARTTHRFRCSFVCCGHFCFVRTEVNRSATMFTPAALWRVATVRFSLVPRAQWKIWQPSTRVSILVGYRAVYVSSNTAYALLLLNGKVSDSKDFGTHRASSGFAAAQ